MDAVQESELPGLTLLHRGKVRDMYAVPGYPEQLLMVATDRISAHDVVMSEPIPGKGKVLTRMSLHWFSLLSDIVDNHFITADVANFPVVCQPYQAQLAGRSMWVKRTKVLPIECIVRGYLSGSFWKSYQQDTNVCGFQLPAAMQESDPFPTPLFTPSTKAEAGDHDENISLAQLEEKVGPKLAKQLAQISIALYQRAAEYGRSKGIIIADTKFEFGKIGDQLILIDEVLTPDSSRFWPLAEYRAGQGQNSFDKQFLRDYLSSTDWNKQAPAPTLPLKIREKTGQRYQEALTYLLDGSESAGS